MSEPHKEHKKHYVKGVKFGVVTISTSRWKDLKDGKKIIDPSGDFCMEYIKSSGHSVVFRDLIPDDKNMIENIVNKAVELGVDILITIGGTGITGDDITIETIEPMFSKKLPGFGELFRYLSYKEIGSSAFLSRASAGIINKMCVFLLPGSLNAVKLALEKLIINEAGHIKYMLERVVG